MLIVNSLFIFILFKLAIVKLATAIPNPAEDSRMPNPVGPVLKISLAITGESVSNPKIKIAIASIIINRCLMIFKLNIYFIDLMICRSFVRSFFCPLFMSGNINKL